MGARYLASILLMALAAPASAEYAYDPADVPADFTCRPGDGPQECARDRRDAAWQARFGEAFAEWFGQLAFDPDLYFDQARREEDRDARTYALPTPNLVDAVYSIALRRYQGWAFAINEVCPDTSRKPGSCRPILRLASPKPAGTPAPAWLNGFLPDKREEVARQLAVTFDWREADLRSCPPAMAMLGTFKSTMPPLWPRRYLDALAGDGEPVTESDEIVVTADGDGVVLRASGRADPTDPHFPSETRSYFASQANGGEAYDWAKAMRKAIEPCLAPSSAPPPWERRLARPERQGSTEEHG